MESTEVVAEKLIKALHESKKLELEIAELKETLLTAPDARDKYQTKFGSVNLQKGRTTTTCNLAGIAKIIDTQRLLAIATVSFKKLETELSSTEMTKCAKYISREAGSPTYVYKAT